MATYDNTVDKLNKILPNTSVQHIPVHSPQFSTCRTLHLSSVHTDPLTSAHTGPFTSAHTGPFTSVQFTPAHTPQFSSHHRPIHPSTAQQPSPELLFSVTTSANLNYTNNHENKYNTEEHFFIFKWKRDIIISALVPQQTHDTLTIHIHVHAETRKPLAKSTTVRKESEHDMKIIF